MEDSYMSKIKKIIAIEMVLVIILCSVITIKNSGLCESIGINRSINIWKSTDIPRG